LFLLLPPRPSRSPLFPYTTLFRSPGSDILLRSCVHLLLQGADQHLTIHICECRIPLRTEEPLNFGFIRLCRPITGVSFQAFQRHAVILHSLQDDGVRKVLINRDIAHIRTSEILILGLARIFLDCLRFSSPPSRRRSAPSGYAPFWRGLS